MEKINFIIALFFIFCLTGCGSEIDKLKKYAENNDVDAQMKLAKIYYDGTKKVAQDYKESFKYYSKAAENNNKDAQLEMVWMLFRGQGTDRDFKKAVELLNKYECEYFINLYNGISKIVLKSENLFYKQYVSGFSILNNHSQDCEKLNIIDLNYKANIFAYSLYYIWFSDFLDHLLISYINYRYK